MVAEWTHRWVAGIVGLLHHPHRHRGVAITPSQSEDRVAGNCGNCRRRGPGVMARTHDRQGDLDRDLDSGVPHGASMVIVGLLVPVVVASGVRSSRTRRQERAMDGSSPPRGRGRMESCSSARPCTTSGSPRWPLQAGEVIPDLSNR